MGVWDGGERRAESDLSSNLKLREAQLHANEQRRRTVAGRSSVWHRPRCEACVGEPAIVVRSSLHKGLAVVSAKPSATTFENANTHSTNWYISRQQRAGELQPPPRGRRGITEVHSSTAGPESCQWHSSLWQQLIKITLIYSCMLPGMTKS